MNYQYRVGGSLAYNHPTYIERNADRELLTALKNGQFCYVFNCRQMGKSSLRVRVTHILQQLGMDCASVDITSIGSNDNLSQWYNGVITRLFLGFNLTGKINLKSWLRDREDLPPVQRLGQFIEEVLLVYCRGEKIYIFIDEIDKILSLQFSLDDFFSLIRYCYNQRAENSQYERITFALFGVATPADLIREKTQTSFNIGQAIELTGFNLAEIAPLAAGLSSQSNYQPDCLEKVIFWTGGQPFLTQKICQLLLESDLNIERLIKERIINNWESQDEPVHLRTIADRLLRNQDKAGRLLGIYQQILEKGAILCDDSPEQGELRLSGLVVKKDNQLVVYNPIYREIFNLNWLEKQLEQLRPYSEAIAAWQQSNYTDESRLLRGKALNNALDWSQGKSLSNLDYQFLTASQNLDKREAEISLETQKQANKILAIAHQKATKRIKIGSVILIVSLLGSLLAFIQVKQAWQQVETAQLGIQLQRQGDSYWQQFQFEQLESLIAAMQAVNSLKNIVTDGQTLSKYPATSPIITLQQILDRIQEKNQLQGHRGTIYSVSISPDRQKIATASQDGTVKIWNQKGENIQTLTGHQGAVYSVSFSPDGQKIATASEDKTAKIWNLQGQNLVTYPDHQESVYSVSFSPDGQKIVTTSRDKTARLWNLSGQTLQVFKGHKRSIDAASFSPDGQKIATASRDGTIKIWDLSGKIILSLGQENIEAFYSVNFSPDGQKIAGAAADKTAKIWDLQGNLIATFQGHQDFVNSVNFSPDGQFIITASSDGSAKIWGLQGEEITTLRGHQESVFTALFSQDGKQVVTGSSDETAKIWQLNNLNQARADNTSVSINFQGNIIAIANKDGQITLLNSQGKKIREFTTKMRSIYSIAFHPDSNQIAITGRSGKVQIWSKKGTMLQEFTASQVPIYSLAFNGEGTAIITGTSEGKVQYWHLSNYRPQLINSWTADDSIIYNLVFSPDHQKIATATRGKIKIWDLQGNLLKEIKTDSFPVYGVSFSPDGEKIAAISRDGTARRWDMDGNLRSEFKIEEDIVYGITFSPDGQEIVIIARDGQKHRWPLETEYNYLQKLLDRGCLWLEDYLRTRPEKREALSPCTGKIKPFTF
jgi:WD40 repeat protein